MAIYEKQTWIGSTDPLHADPDSTPITDTRLNHMEDGILDASETGEQAYTDIVEHKSSATPHAVYDDAIDFSLIFENGLI